MATPGEVLRYCPKRWIPGLELLTGAVLLAAVLPFKQPLIVLAGFVLGFVFALYDVLFNVAFVGAVVVAALVVPASGESPIAVVGTALLLIITAGWYARLRRSGIRPATSTLVVGERSALARRGEPRGAGGPRGCPGARSGRRARPRPRRQASTERRGNAGGPRTDRRTGRWR